MRVCAGRDDGGETLITHVCLCGCAQFKTDWMQLSHEVDSQGNAALITVHTSRVSLHTHLCMYDTSTHRRALQGRDGGCPREAELRRRR